MTRGVCDNCLCCNWESNPSSRNYGCAGLCDINGHTASTPHNTVIAAVRAQKEAWDAADKKFFG